ncbi:MAG: radical SAM protein [Thermoplasmatales archaeon]|nr:MAG: radical SAM protein [Thermoplasmatales archaeon]
MKIILLYIAPGYEFWSETKKNRTKSSYHPPLGLLYIGATLEDQGHKVEIIDFHAEKHPVDSLRKSLPSADAVGISVYSQAYKESAQVARKIKEIDPSLPIIVGGPHCSLHPKKSLTEVPAADISVEGEAEYVINDIFQALKGRKQLSTIPGVYYRENDNIKSGKPQLLVYDLDSLPFPARHLVDKYDYGKIKNSYFFKPKFTSMITSRGCPFRCRFCTRNTHSFKTYRKRSIENVVAEIQEIDGNYRSVIIVDDNFLADKKRVHKIMDRLIEMGTDMEVYIEGARVDTAERSLFEKMKRAGVKHLYFGIESGNQDVLDFYDKKTNLEQIRKAVHLSREMGFFTGASFIFGAPIETKHHIEQTIKFACSLPLDTAVFNLFTYKYGSDIWDEAVKNGNIKETEEYAIMADSNKGLGNFTKEELAAFYRKALVRFYLRPSYIKRQAFRSLQRKDFNGIKIGLRHLSNILT